MNRTDYIRAWSRELDLLRAKNLFRIMPEASGEPGRYIYLNGRRMLNFSSNNYLGLASHPELIEAAHNYAARFGIGSTASRLIAGNNVVHRELEDEVAAWKGTEASLVFATGYQANVGVVSALLDESDIVLSDALNHASIIDGCRLSKAKTVVYRHVDLHHLKELLKFHESSRKLVITESIFSMDGDYAPLKDIDALCTQYGAILMVDEAHSGGVVGPKGSGLAVRDGVKPEIHMGTLGKALGVSGAYIAGSRTLIDLLINKSRSFIFSTAPSPAVTGAAKEAIRITASSDGDRRRNTLATNIEHIRHLLKGLPVETPDNPSHIIPIIIGDSGKTMRISETCRNNGLFAHGIRYPTVKEESARIRFTITSEHTSEDLEHAVSVLKQAIEEEL